MKLQNKIEELKGKIQRLQRQVDSKKSKTLVQCQSSVFGKGCGRKTQINKIEYIQTHWYVSPYGCTEGDYWNEGEGNFICPKCGVRNRLYERPEIEDLKKFFMAIKEEYRD